MTSQSLNMDETSLKLLFFLNYLDRQYLEHCTWFLKLQHDERAIPSQNIKLENADAMH